jgi:UDP-glucose 4-epimerase
MKVLVSGGCGFIGKSTCAALVELGHEPVAFDRSRPADFPHEAVEGDITDRAAVAAVIAEVAPDAVIHLAALLASDTIADLDAGTQINVVGMQNVLDAAADAGVGRFVYASSIAVYGDQPDWGDKPVSEDDHGRPFFLYGWQKQLNEALAAAYQEKMGIRCVGLRISTVWGAGRKTGFSAPVNAMLEGALKGHAKCPFGPKADSCMIHVGDVGKEFATLATAPAPAHDVYNAGGEYSTIGQLADLVKEVHPEATVELGPDDQRIPHVSLIDASRIEGEFGIQPRSFLGWAKSALEGAG